MMSQIFTDNSLSIGKTPLVQLNRVVGDTTAKVLAKIESRNPAFSVKCRVGASLIWDAEKSGKLKQGIEIVEPTSGNTGIALAFVAASRGYKITITMPDSMSLERRRLLKVLGANLVLTPAALGMKGAIEAAHEIVKANPERTFMPDQFSNPANPAIHRATTGPEIWNDTQGEVDVYVSGIGTGGSFTGVSRYLKLDQKKSVHCVAVEPEESPVISQTLANQKLEPAPHKIQGIGAGFVPKNLDLPLIDQVMTVSSDEAMEMARRLAKEEGILAGISSGAATAAAIKLAYEPRFANKTIVVILPDSGERYLSSALFEGLLDD
jgi:cysteine synthase A